MLQRYVEGNTGADAPTHVAVIFDKGSHTFRNDMYDQYKANREAMPEDLRPQIPLTRDATEAFNIACKEIEGYEADDIIATLPSGARRGRARDDHQLGQGPDAAGRRRGRNAGRHEEPPDRPRRVSRKFGVCPDRVVDVQALAGDSVDNVPGAPGIGIKTAALLINEYGDLDALLDRAEEIKQPKRRQTLIDNADQIRLSRQLVQLDCEHAARLHAGRSGSARSRSRHAAGVPRRDGVPHAVQTHCRQARAEAPVIAEPPGCADVRPRPNARSTPDLRHASATMDALHTWIDRIRARGYVAVDTETTSLNEMQRRAGRHLAGVEPGQACYIPLIHKATAQAMTCSAPTSWPRGRCRCEDALAMLKPVLEDRAILKIGQNMKYDAKIFARTASPWPRSTTRC